MTTTTAQDLGTFYKELVHEGIRPDFAENIVHIYAMEDARDNVLRIRGCTCR